MTEHHDDLLNRLAAADPVDPTELPAATDPTAQELLRTTLAKDQNELALAGSTSSSTPQPTPQSESDNPMTPPAITTDEPRPSGPVVDLDKARRPRRGRGMLVGAAAAVLLLVGGLLVFSPDTTPSAVAAVQSAAQAAADADTGRITTTFTASGQDGEEFGALSGSFEAAYAGEDIAVSLSIDEVDASFPVEGLPATEARLVDDVIYVNPEGEWFAVDTDGLLGQVVSDFIDPRTVLETVQAELTETEEIGTATIDGVETTHYRSIVDLADESLSASGWVGFDGVPIETDGEITVDLYVDGDGLLRQLDVSGDLSETSATTGESVGSGTFAVSTLFHDLGGDITVEAPADVEVFDPMEDFFGEDE